MSETLEQFLVCLPCSIREALEQIDHNGRGIVFQVNEDRCLVRSITDGDLRRAILKGDKLDDSLEVLDWNPTSDSGPVCAPEGTPAADLLAAMNKYGVRQIPVITSDRRIVDVSFLSDVIKQYELPLRAVIMAGGYGKRLLPLTSNTPKPMLPVGGRPLLERTIEQLKGIGISRFNVTTHYKAEVISEHFGDGRNFGVQIEYVQEDTPLGTAGALRMLSAGEEPLLIINGDILTQVNFRAMLDYHRAHKAQLTVGVRQYEMQVPYGVVECQGASVTRISEKPKLNFFVNAGIYILEPTLRDLVPSDQRFDMTDLIQRLIEYQRLVVSFPIAEYWLDVGSPLEYERAQQDIVSGRLPA